MPSYTEDDLQRFYCRLQSKERPITYKEIARLYNFSLAITKRRRASAAELKRASVANTICAVLGSPDAVLAQGWFYLNGIGTDTDLGAAKQWYFKAADLKDSRAYYSLGEINERQGDNARARDWYRKAARLGNCDAALRLAVLGLEPKSTRRQLAGALRWLGLAEAQGNAKARRFAKSKIVRAARIRVDGCAQSELRRSV